MSIVKRKPLLPPTPKLNPPNIKSPELVNNFVDTKLTPLTHLVTNIEGSKWVVNLYTQVIDRDDALAGHDIGQGAVYQQYKLIKGFELKVSNPLSTSQDQESKSMNVTGSAHCHSLVICNHGDMFIADVGDGRSGLFQITLSEKKSIFSDSVYYLEYALISYVDAEPETIRDLDSKVVLSLNYVKDYINYGQNPLIADNEFNALQKLQDLQKNIITAYYRWFYNEDRKTFLVPGQDNSTYDHYLNNFLMSVLENNDHPKVRQTKIYNVQDDLYLKEPTLLQAILDRDLVLLDVVNKKMGLVNARLFSIDPMLEGIRYSRIAYVVYPSEPYTLFGSLSTGITPKPLSNVALLNVSSMKDSTTELIENNILTDLVKPVTIHPVLKDDYYILSNEFYNNGQNMSKLEILIKKYFNENVVNAVEIQDVVKDYNNWGGLERFYYIPLIIAMTKYLLFRSS